MGTFVSAGHGRGVAWNANMTDATFRTFCTYLKAALDGCGLVQTSDTGQINTSTVTWPTTNNADGGYFIYRFNDAQQGTDPIFLKIRPGRGTAATLTRIYMQVGQGSNGSGTLTGTLSTSMCMGQSYGVTVVTTDPASTDYAYHGAGVAWVAMCAAATGTNYPPRHWFCVARTRDQSTGSFDARGALIFGCTGDPTDRTEMCFVNWTRGVEHARGISNDFSLVMPSTGLTDAGDRIAQPHFYQDAGVVKQAWATWTTYASFLTTGVNSFTASPYGTSRLWWSLGDNSGRAMRGLGVASANWALVLPWE